MSDRRQATDFDSLIKCDDIHCVSHKGAGLCGRGVINVEGGECVNKMYTDDVASCTSEACEYNQSYMCNLPAEKRKEYIVHGRCTYEGGENRPGLGFAMGALSDGCASNG